MSHGRDPAVEKCPECHAEIAPGAQDCWLCHARLAPHAAQQKVGPVAPVLRVPTRAAQAWPTNPVGATQFQLSSLLLTITVVCLCLGLIRWAPGVVIPLLIVAVPALIRTMVVSRRAAGAGKPLGVGAKIQSFLVSAFVVILVIIGAVVALCAACFAIVFSAMH